MTHPSVLVAYGSTRGGTVEIAEWIADELDANGVAAHLAPADRVRSLDGYDGVVVGGALYTGRWHRHARGFTRRFARTLRGLPVWLFCSGPLDNSADDPAARPVFGAASVAKAAERVHARDFAVFGGRLEAGARGFPAAAMAKKAAGDFRDRERVRQWASGIAAALCAEAR